MMWPNGKALLRRGACGPLAPFSRCPHCKMKEQSSLPLRGSAAEGSNTCSLGQTPSAFHCSALSLLVATAKRESLEYQSALMTGR